MQGLQNVNTFGINKTGNIRMNAILRHVRLTTVGVEKQCVIYSECVFVVLGIQHAISMWLGRIFPYYLISGKIVYFHSLAVYCNMSVLHTEFCSRYNQQQR
jgi:hypothetical protein